MIANTTALHAMCGALPVNPEDAPGIAAAAQRLKDRPAQELPEVEVRVVSYGALLPAEEPIRVFEYLTRQMSGDPEYAWAWHCNLAMPIMDELNCTHEQANRAAARIMSTLFDVDVTTTHYWASFPWCRTDQLSRDLIEAARDARGG